MITVTLETAEKMKDAGWVKSCEYNLIKTGKDGIGIYHKSYEFKLDYYISVEFLAYVPTAQEIREELPNGVIITRGTHKK